MSKLFKTIMAFTLITVLSVCIVFESNATPVVTNVIDQHTVDEGETDTEQLSSTSEVDSWTMKPAQGFINFFMNDIPIASVYQMTLLKGSEIIATATNAGKTNALIKCRVNGTSTYEIQIKYLSGTFYQNESYNFRYRTFETNSTVTGSMFSFQFFNFDSRTGAQQAVSQMWAMGYGGNEYYNNSANAAYSVMDTSDVFMAMAPTTTAGAMKFHKSTSEYATMYANASSLQTGDISLNSAPAGYMADVELAIFAGPYTGTGSTNLATKSVEKGAFCAIGFNNSYDHTAYNRWSTLFFSYLRQGYTVKAALIQTNISINGQNNNIYPNFGISRISYTATAESLVFNS